MRKFWGSISIGLCSATVLLATTTYAGNRPGEGLRRNGSPSQQGTANRITIMSWNVENLFDTIHDEGTLDYEYLPTELKLNNPAMRQGCYDANSNPKQAQACVRHDWNEERLKVKLAHVADGIRQINGCGPDIQILVEVENQNVVEMLRDSELSECGYQTVVVLDGQDKRGIDPGVMSKFKQWAPPILHNIPFHAENGDPAPKGFRGILEVHLLLPDGQKASIFAVHFPSQSNPTYLRRQAVEFLQKVTNAVSNDVLVIVGGDFNIIASEENEHNYIAGDLAGNYVVSQLEGCKGCVGSYYYPRDNTWSWFDMLLFSPEVKGKGPWMLDTASIRLPTEGQHQKTAKGTPMRWNDESMTGTTDHFPIFAELYRR